MPEYNTVFRQRNFISAFTSVDSWPSKRDYSVKTNSPSFFAKTIFLLKTFTT